MLSSTSDFRLRQLSCTLTVIALPESRVTSRRPVGPGGAEYGRSPDRTRTGRYRATGYAP
eukprot:333458-Hanusia_phi.AAC.1